MAAKAAAIVAAILSLAVLCFGAIRRGDPPPAVMLRDGATRIKLEEIAGDMSVLLLSPPDVLAPADCLALSNARDQLARNRITLVIVATSYGDCAASKERFLMVAGVEDIRKLFADAPEGKPRWRSVIADPFKTVRDMGTFPPSANAIASIGKRAADWESGRQIFSGACGHCHGDDGADTSYVGIKTLAGISQRLSGEAILDGGRQFGAVDMATWSADTLWARSSVPRRVADGDNEESVPRVQAMTATHTNSMAETDASSNPPGYPEQAAPRPPRVRTAAYRSERASRGDILSTP